MPELDPVTQKFIADTAPYVAALQAAVDEAQKLRDAAAEAATAFSDLMGSMGRTTGSALALTGAENDLSHAMADKTGMVMLQAERLDDLRSAMGYAYVAAHLLAAGEADLEHQLALTAGMTGIAVRAAQDLALNSGYASMALDAQQHALEGVGHDLVLAAGEAGTFGRAEYDLIAVMAEKTGAASRQGSELGDLGGRMVRTAGDAEILRGAEDHLALTSAAAASGMTIAWNTATLAAGDAARAGGAANRSLFQMFGGWSNVVHWVIMGSLEILATAIPALVAFGGAIAGMFQTFGHMYDVMNALYTASGSLAGAFRNSVPPLQALGAAGQRVEQFLKPDAYIIFGSAIEAVTSHVGAFSHLFEQAGNALATFASKVAGEMSGGFGQQLLGFFKSALQDMIQWGQVLGNFGHAFINIMGSMWGVARVVLGVWDAMSKALEVLTTVPVIRWMIGLAAAFSAAYRYGKLLMFVFNWLGGGAAVTGIKAAVTWIRSLGAAFMEAYAEEGTFGAGLAVVGSEFGALFAETWPVIVAIGAIAAIAAVWATSGNEVSDSTTRLISKVEGESQTVANLTHGIKALTDQYAVVQKSATSGAESVARYGKAYAFAANATKYDMNALTTAIETQTRKLIALEIGLAQTGQRAGQVGADMNAMAIQTALADSKITSVNQALDDYISLLTGGTSAEAGFVSALSNLSTGTNKITNVLGTSGSVTLSIKQFSESLNHMGATGAQAWTNLNQIFTSNAEPLMDWFRQAGVLIPSVGQKMQQAALDIAAPLVRLVKDSPTATAELLGFVRAQGDNVKSLGQLEQQIKGTGAGMKNLTGLTDMTTRQLANLSQMAKNVGDALNSQVASGLANAALKSTNYDKDLQTLQNDMANGAPRAKLMQDYRKIADDTQTATNRAVAMGNGYTSAMGQAANATQRMESQVASSLGLAGAALRRFQGEVAAMANATKTQMEQAALAVQRLQQWINSLHGKTITVNTIFNNQRVGPATAGPGGRPASQAGTIHGGIAGYAGGGIVQGPGGFDAIPAWLTQGEGILTTAAVSALGGPLAIHALNQRPTVVSTGGLGGGGGVVVLHASIPVSLDGRAIQTTQRTQTLIYNRRNPTNNLNLRVR